MRILREKVEPNAQYVWFHAASLGEFEQGRPLIEQIRKDYPQYKILLTFFSPSGYEVRKNYEGADIITYLPIDTVGNARRFLRTVRPVMAFFIKYDFGIITCISCSIVIYQSIACQAFSVQIKSSLVVWSWLWSCFKCFSRFFVQNEESKELLNKIGISDAVVVGDTRFDRVLQIKEASKKLPLVEKFVNRDAADRKKVFVAGSSWQPDEEIFL